MLSVFGTLTAGGALTAGTGAFSSVQADRDIEVNVAGDASAYLGIVPASGPNGAYADVNGGPLTLDFTGSNDNIGGSLSGGTGVNSDAITYFESVFEIRNNGTQEVDVMVSPLTFFDTASGDILLALLIPDMTFPGNFTLGVGDAKMFHVVIASIGDATSSGPSINGTIDIVAEATP
ncbi:hypothetical protein DJ69_13070 [Halorubrum persicum]|uniref:DUF1102 domain-containing protein n=1 Tax=Halorubrum persicum TaxID=1383844 RepID=A0A2G1WGT3_9EURY|nr:DUF1102 domain-containing protein [Halorubrum persicum]PHQ38170.1 hypothetical protein DJ69_13070 [Halorubrum persicum]